jgi:hypothetical protein
MLNNQSICDKLFIPLTSENIDVFSNYPESSPPIKPIINHPFINSKSAEEDYSDEKDIYREALEEIFVYDFYPNDDYDIISFNIPYLKQNKNMSFPSVLVFNKLPESLQYEVRSKHYLK